MTSDPYMYEGDDTPSGRPQWFKLWACKYADALDIDNLDDDLPPEEKEEFFAEVGRAFINAMFYFHTYAYGETEYATYKLHTRDGRIIWNALKRDIDQSYKDYAERVAYGRKGGRPKKQETP